METSVHNVPVTALHTFPLNDRVFILAGEGPILTVLDGERGHLCFRQRVFEFEVIHGIASQISASLQPGELGRKILVCAGSAVGILSLILVGGARGQKREGLIVFEGLCTTKISDRALFGAFFGPDASGKVRAYAVTARNEVLQLASDQPSATGSTSMRFERLVSGPRCVLYSAHARSSSKGLLVAAGTVFGELVVWLASEDKAVNIWSSSILHIFLGHKGSVFGVHLSERLSFAGEERRLLASCSDDRTIRLWQINDEINCTNHSSKDAANSVQLSDVTGFGNFEDNSNSSLAVTWGHLSRVWTVRFLPQLSSGLMEKIALISTGEDASFRMWHATVPSGVNSDALTSLQFKENACHHNHFGKNIWSSDCSIATGKLVQYTGGADGAIVATRLPDLASSQTHTRDFHAQIKFGKSSQQLAAVNPREPSFTFPATGLFKQYALINDDSLFVSTVNGDVVHGKLRAVNQVVWRHISSNKSTSPVLMCVDKPSQLMLFTGVDRCLNFLKEDSLDIISSSIAITPEATLLLAVQIEDQTLPRNGHSSIIIPIPSKCSLILMEVQVNDIIYLKSSKELRLPPKFVPTSGCHHVEQKILVLGARNGSVAIFDLTGPELMAVTSFDVHATDTITSISFVSSVKQRPHTDLYLVSTGRDGTYALHRISPSPTIGQAWTLHTVHRSSPPMGPNIEGAYVVWSPVTCKHDLVLYGFKSTNFVVWNETDQSEVLAVDCGGAHRSWAYSPLKSDPSRASLHGGTFVWTKAGFCNIYRKSDLAHRKIQPGGHGREIKALAVSPIRVPGRSPGGAILIATGAEDTTIRLFIFDSEPDATIGEEKKMACIRTLSKHTTGIHHLEFSPCGRYLFSSGGCEELFVWRLHSNLPVIGVGVVLEAMLPKTAVDADARITSFKINQRKMQNEVADNNHVGLDITTTYSNGKVKILGYCFEQGGFKGHFQLLEESTKGSLCWTELQHDADEDFMLIAGTDGFLNVHFPRTWGWRWPQRLHQNNIQASLFSKLPRYSSTWFIATGGDDNAIGLTIYCCDAATSTLLGSPFRTMIIPKAHAAAVTGLAMISQTTTNNGCDIITFASVSNDQRVKIWRVTIKTNAIPQRDNTIQEIEVEKVAECWTSIADASSIEYLPPSINEDMKPSRVEGGEGHSFPSLLVVGVGMEILHIPADQQGLRESCTLFLAS